MNLIISKIISILLSVVVAVSSLITTLFDKEYKSDSVVPGDYTTVLVHGFFGFGPSAGINGVATYWGATACDLEKEMNLLGYDCVTAEVGPLSSAWDRACELYAQLTGTTVDYGENHSKEHNHARYGEEYTEPLVENWGGLDENGKKVKLNFVCHSFGGNTVRLMLDLLAHGDVDEMRETTDGSISPLFTGGKTDYVNAIATVASPNNGTTFIYAGKEAGFLDMIERFFYGLGAFADETSFRQLMDFKLDHFGLEQGEDESNIEYLLRVIKHTKENCKNDSAFYDLSCDGTLELNRRCDTEPGVYYYAVPLCASEADENGNQVPIKEANFFIKPFIRLIGSYKENTETDFVLDESWLPNDGMVNTRSEFAPDDELSVNIDFGDRTEAGVWNVLPIRVGDHAYAVGMGGSKAECLDYYTQLFNLINSN